MHSVQRSTYQAAGAHHAAITQWIQLARQSPVDNIKMICCLSMVAVTASCCRALKVVACQYCCRSCCKMVFLCASATEDISREATCSRSDHCTHNHCAAAKAAHHRAMSQ